MGKEYCILFGDHKSNPCACGWSSENSLEHFLKRQIDECKQQLGDATGSHKTFLLGLSDGFNRTLLWLDMQRQHGVAGKRDG